MNKIALWLVLAFAFSFADAYGKPIDSVYLDYGRLFFAHAPDNEKLAVPLYVYSPAGLYNCLNLPVVLEPITDSYGPKFPFYPDFPPISLCWQFRNGSPQSIQADMSLDALSRMRVFWVWGAFEPRHPENSLPSVRVTMVSGRTEENVYSSEVFSVYRSQSRKESIHPLHSWGFYSSGGRYLWDCVCPSMKEIAEDSNRKKPNDFSRVKNLWCAMSGTNLIARLPYEETPRYELSDSARTEKKGKSILENSAYGESPKPLYLWWPTEKPNMFSWMEIQMNENTPSTDRFSVVHIEDIRPDGFDPVGAVRIAGKAVRTDAAESLFPKDADWLIWEKNTNGVTRLCQMKGGRWTPVREVSRAPQTIVVDNDTETVYLLYDFAIDRAEIDDSLRRLASLLKPPQPAP